MQDGCPGQNKNKGVAAEGKVKRGGHDNKELCGHHSPGIHRFCSCRHKRKEAVPHNATQPLSFGGFDAVRRFLLSCKGEVGRFGQVWKTDPSTCL
jgi:hypothetical protein